MNGGVPLEVPLGAQLGDLAFDLLDHTDPHFAIVTDPAFTGDVTYTGLSLGEILEGTPGTRQRSRRPIGGDTGYFLVSTTPAGADIYLVDISAQPVPEGQHRRRPAERHHHAHGDADEADRRESLGVTKRRSIPSRNIRPRVRPSRSA